MLRILVGLGTCKIKKRHVALLLLLFMVLSFRNIACLANLYAKHIYPFIGSMLSPISSFFSFPIGDIFISVSVAWVLVYPFYAVFHKKESKKTVFLRVAEFLLWIYVWFYIAWGLNYSQPNIYCRLKMKPVEVSEKEFRELAYNYADSLNAAYQYAHYIDKHEVADAVLQGYEELSSSTEYTGINAPFYYRSKAKTMLFSSLCSMAGVTGSMAPFFCEFTLNADLQAHEYPATYAHEFSHFLGIANEGEANFYSYLVCTKSHNPTIRFSGYYQIFFYVLADVRELLGDEEFKRYIKHIRPEIVNLARSDRKYWLSKRCKVIDETQNFFYNIYLRSNRIKNGMESYSGVIGIIMAWNALENREMKHALQH